SNMLLSPSKLIEAEAASRDALHIRRRLFGDNDPQTAHSLATLALVLLDEAKVTIDQGKLAEAEGTLREALAIQSKHPDGEVLQVYLYLGYLGDGLRDQKKLAQAEETYREALTLGRQLLGNNNNPKVQNAILGLAGCLSQKGDYAEAAKLYEEAANGG